jgi:hypothetical protein
LWEVGTPHPSLLQKEKSVCKSGQGRKARKNAEIMCYNCKMKGHYARNCPKTRRRKFERDSCQEMMGNGNRLSEGSRPTVSSAQ